MASEWKSQIGGGKYAIQFETDSREYYKLVEKVCQKAVDMNDKAVQKARANKMSVLGHL